MSLNTVTEDMQRIANISWEFKGNELHILSVRPSFDNLPSAMATTGITLVFDIHLTPRAWFPFWTQSKVTSRNALWSAAGITSGIAPFTLYCTSLETISTTR